MNLEEAKKEYGRSKLRYRYIDGRKIKHIAEASAALDAAVRDLALAVMNDCLSYHGQTREFLRDTETREILRHFPPEKGEGERCIQMRQQECGRSNTNLESDR